MGNAALRCNTETVDTVIRLALCQAGDSLVDDTVTSCLDGIIGMWLLHLPSGHLRAPQ